MKRTALLIGIMVIAFGAPLSAQNPTSEDPALYAVGALGASNLYTTYFLLGTLADGYATAAYTAQFAEELANDIIGLNESSIDVLNQLVDEGNLSPSDMLLVEEMITAHELLILQTWGLLEYVNDPTQTDEWFEYRREAWELIRELLNIE